ncbi:MAG: hypothetical protein ACLGI9_00905 [Thermoanaerobaculia bacterium]
MLLRNETNVGVSGSRKNIFGGRVLARHPWEITLREFIEIARRDYGIDVTRASAEIIVGRSLSGNRRIFALPDMDEDEVLEVDVVLSLCRAFHIPPVDLRLGPEPEED